MRVEERYSFDSIIINFDLYFDEVRKCCCAVLASCGFASFVLQSPLVTMCSCRIPLLPSSLFHCRSCVKVFGRNNHVVLVPEVHRRKEHIRRLLTVGQADGTGDKSIRRCVLAARLVLSHD